MQYLSFGILMATLAGCGFFAKSDKDSDGGQKILKEELASKDAETILSIDEGELAGTELVIPLGALAIDANFAVAESDAPASFTTDGDVVAATKALRISATGADGSDITTLQQPLTLSLPLGDALGLSAVEKTEDNLCAFLETSAGDKFLWRRSSLQLSADRKKVSLTSIKLGTFQIVFCGSKDIAGFSDVEQTEVVTGTKVESFAIITVPASKFNYGQTHVCGGVVSQGSGDLLYASYVGFGAAAFSGKDVTLRFTYEDGKDSTAFNQDYAVFFITMQDKACEKYDQVEDYFLATNGKLRPNAITMLVSKDDLLAGKVKGTLGQAGTIFELQKIALELGKPDDTSTDTDFSGVDFPRLCLMAEDGFGNYTIKVKQGAFYDRNDQPLSHVYFHSTSEMPFHLVLNPNLCADVAIDDSGTTQRFFARSEKTVMEVDSVNILPVTFNIKTGQYNFDTGSFTPDTPTTGQNFCLSLFPASKIASEDSIGFYEETDSEIFHMGGLVTTGVNGNSKNYLAPVFYYSEDNYYLKTWLDNTPIDPSDRCNTSNINYVKNLTSGNLTWTAPVNTGTK